MNVYYLTIVSVFFTALIAQYAGRSNQNNVFFVFLTGFILTIVAGLRYKVGTDYTQYIANYNFYITEFWDNLIRFNEPGVSIIAKISSWIYDDYATYIFLASVITIGLSINTISKYSKTFMFSVLLFIFIGAWHGSFNGVRQFLACAIIFAGHRYIIEKKLLKYFIVLFLASMFHITAAVMAFLYLIPLKKLNLTKTILLVVGSMLLLYSYSYIFDFVDTIKGKSIVLDEYVLTEVNYFRIAVSFAPLLAYYFLSSKTRLNSEDYFYINILFINAALMYVTSSSAYLARIAIYTNIFTVLSLPRILNLKNPILDTLIKYLIIILYAFFWYVEVSNSYSLSNFQWIFER